ncbi:MAG: hypothetical protein JGK17_20160 [Microcoleus sp. PH2017_10_PVI_O_A]|uniref:hypothetical protein n=1 Tax=unclassified Microcoleus TaxID=2642155 RepID=UPI001D603938|nr:MULTISPECIES: hypothetical protein [unclassified Microcoleus]TAE79218.1 MAG: hypothetical protein EAZ83_22320 [Oscillatoriales cyanobacterium]MCC3407861.1 hypothetical protein [Microcoleus sp. PH2017_10_PVI_O_A]MCC3462557.1 hypothetical protein [Microcoleus sp. PH2017_11_PCY_U_A]MCC3480979.1 hypothetical protein [Microcoleus sp. PH2017_12_PCY_D_A]MCC3526665.1 hypothetical protein [Microcoleus sp. PH2017_21_RUC_O_A]
MRAIEPKTIDIVCPLISGNYLDNPIKVTTKSPKTYRKAVYLIAQFFRREFGYDFTQYGYEGEETDPNSVAFLWIHPEAEGYSKEFKVPCIGACCFRLRPSGYGLQWIWLHPYLRRQGLLSDTWPEFINEFGKFSVEHPLSDAMKAFLNKHNFEYR